MKRWRESGYRGVSSVTRDLLNHWSSKERGRRLFFCQLEAVETIIYLNELRLAGKSSRTKFQKFSLDDEAIQNLLRGERSAFHISADQSYPRLVDIPSDAQLLPLRRLGCKMATGSGKTVVMSMLMPGLFVIALIIPSAVNNWGQLGVWDLHVCRNPQLLEKELEYIDNTCRD